MKLPEKIRKITCETTIKNQREFCYIINKGGEDETKIHVSISPLENFFVSKKVIDDSHSFIEGLKLVQMADRKYAYIRESDGQLLPYRYDIATDFNEYGFALVGKHGCVSWMDASFHILNVSGEMVEQNEEHGEITDGFEEITEFSAGSIPLSKVVDSRHIYYGSVSYFGIDGKLKEFIQYNENPSLSYLSFKNGTRFDKRGIAISEDKILFAQGYYCLLKDVIKLYRHAAFFHQLSEDMQISESTLHQYIKKSCYKSV